MLTLPWDQGAGAFCAYNETIAVSGAGSFFIDYRAPYLYVTDEGTSDDGVFKIYDMADMVTGPVLKSTTSMATNTKPQHPKAHSLPGYGTVLLIPCNLSKELQIWDVNDPSSPSLLGSCDVSAKGNPVSVGAIGDVACVGYSTAGGTSPTASKIDISDPTSPTIVANYTSSNRRGSFIEVTTDHFIISGEHSSAGPVFLAALRASDFAERDSATDGGGFAGIGTGALALNGDFSVAFTTNGGGAGVAAWNIADVTNITLIDLEAVLGAASGSQCCALKDDADRLYVGRGSGGGLQIDIIDVSNPADMNYVGAISTSGETVTDVALITDGCAGLAWGQGTGAAIHLRGSPPLS